MNFNTQNHVLFKISSSVSGLFLKYFYLIFFKFHPRCSYSINSYKKSVGEELIYRGRDFNICLFFCLAPLDFPLHWRSQSWGYEYLWMDVNLSAVDKLPLIIITILALERVNNNYCSEIWLMGDNKITWESYLTT